MTYLVNIIKSHTQIMDSSQLKCGLDIHMVIVCG